MSGFLEGKECRVEFDCYPCFLKQAVIALRLAGADEALGREVMRAVVGEIEVADFSRTPAHATTFMHSRIRRVLGKDPFEEIKSRYNEIALGLYPGLKKRILESGDPLWTATRLAVAGNVIDFGVFTTVDVMGTVEKALGEPIPVDEYGAFREEAGRAPWVLYLLDNAGEIVFDRLLIETLVAAGKEVTAVVKGGPIINDCTMEDARQAGLDRVCEVMENGSEAVGTILETTTEGFRARFDSAPLIVSKGQGNFETLLGRSGKRIFFLFQSKCAVIARLLDLPEGAMLLVSN